MISTNFVAAAAAAAAVQAAGIVAANKSGQVASGGLSPEAAEAVSRAAVDNIKNLSGGKMTNFSIAAIMNGGGSSNRSTDSENIGKIL